MVLSAHTFSAFGFSDLNMLTRSSEWIVNPMRYTVICTRLVYAACTIIPEYYSRVDSMVFLEGPVTRVNQGFPSTGLL